MASVGTAYVDVKADLKGFDDEVERAGKGLVSKFGGFAKTAGKAIAVGLAGAFVGGAVFAKQAIDAASDLNESVSKVGVVFGDAGKDVIAFSKTTAKSLGQSQRQSLEAAGTFGNLFRALGLTEQQSGKMSTSLVTLAGDLASFNNVDPATALDALRSGLVGETEPLRQFGVNINEATLQAKALELGLISSTKQALDPATKAQAAYALVMDQTALAQGDFARTSGGLANQQRILKAELDDVVANLGQQLLPIAVQLATFATEKLVPALAVALPVALEIVGKAFSFLADNVFPKVGRAFQDFVFAFQNPDTKIGAGGWEGVVFRFGQVVRKVVDFVVATWPTVQAAIGAVISFVVTNWPKVQDVIERFAAWLAKSGIPATIEGIRVAVQATVDWITKTAIPALQVAWQWVQDQTGVLAAYVAERWSDIQVAIDNVIAYLKVLLALFLGPIVLIWQAAHEQILGIVLVVWDQIRLYIETAINVIKGIIDVVLGLLSGDWGRAWDGIRGIVEAVWGLITGIITNGIAAIELILSGAWEVIKAAAQVAWDAFKSIITTVADEVVSFVSQLPGRFKDALGDLLSLLVEKGNDLLQGLWNGIKAIASQVEQWFRDLPGNIKGWLGSLADVLKQHGSDLIFGLLRGIEDKAGDVLDWLVHLPEKVVSWIGDLGHVLFDKGESLIQGFIDGIKAKAADIPGIIARAANPGLAIGDFIGSHIPFIGGRASGGLIDRPMVSLIGEAGAEAVINRDQALRLVWNLANASSGQAGGSAGTGGASYQYGPNYITNTVDESDVVAAFRRMELLAG